MNAITDPLQEIYEMDTNFTFINQALNRLQTKKKADNEQGDSHGDNENTAEKISEEMQKFLSNSEDYDVVTRRKFHEIYDAHEKSKSSAEDMHLSNEDIMRCLTDTTIVDLIATKLINSQT